MSLLAPWPAFGFEYVEDTARHSVAWGDLLERYAKEGWRLAFVLHDEGELDVVQARLIFERPRQGPEDEHGYPLTPAAAATPARGPVVARVPTPTGSGQRTVVGRRAPPSNQESDE